MILLNYTDSCILLFSNQVFYSYSCFLFFILIHNININFCNAHFPTFAHFPWKIISIGCLISLTSVLNYSHIVNFLFIFWWSLKQLVSKNQLYLNFIATYNNHLFAIILKIHLFAIFYRTADVFYTFVSFWYQNNGAVSFFFSYSNILVF